MEQQYRLASGYVLWISDHGLPLASGYVLWISDHGLPGSNPTLHVVKYWFFLENKIF